MNGALAQALAHQRELAGFQDSAVRRESVCWSGSRCRRPALALDEQCAVSGRHGGLQHAGAMNAAADDDHIVFFHLH